MHKLAIAERILSLAIPPERAHSTVGDLAEVSESRGAVWFWLSLVQTACVQAVCQLITTKRDFEELMRAVGRGYLMAIGATIVLFFVLILVAGTVWSLANPLFGIDCRNGSSCMPLQHVFLQGVPHILIPFLMGAMVAWSAKGREFPAGLVIALMFVVLGLTQAAISHFLHDPMSFGLLRPPLSLAGALCVRHWRISKIDATPTVHA